MHYFQAPEPGQQVQAVPGAGLEVPLWILGSSLFGAQMAAALGLPYAFASHFAPAMMMQAISLYRSRFKASEQLKQPYVMLGFNVFAADTDEDARFLATSMQQAFVALRTGRPAKLQPPVKGYEAHLSPPQKEMLDQVLSCSAIGGPETVRRQMQAFIERTGADELMITAQIYDHRARLRSYEIAAQAQDAAN
jgi:luciferase family oxidoreductase group 1